MGLPTKFVYLHWHPQASKARFGQSHFNSMITMDETPYVQTNTDTREQLGSGHEYTRIQLTGWNVRPSRVKFSSVLEVWRAYKSIPSSHCNKYVRPYDPVSAATTFTATEFTHASSRMLSIPIFWTRHDGGNARHFRDASYQFESWNFHVNNCAKNYSSDDMRHVYVA